MSSSVKAQDPHFSQFFNTHQLYNPAITGSFDDDVRVSGHYRTQWRAAGKGYVTNAINAEGNFLYNSDSHFSAGVFVLNDLAGNAALKTFQAMASGAYHQKLSRKDAVSAGIQFSMLRRTIDFSGLKWDNQYDGIQYDPSIDPNEIWESNQVKRYDVAMGVNWRHKGELNYTLGYGFRHFGQDVSFLTGSVDRLPLRQTFIGSLERKTPFGLWRYEMLVQRQQRAM